MVTGSDENATEIWCSYRSNEILVVCNNVTYKHPAEHLSPDDAKFWAYIGFYVGLVALCGIMQGLALAILSLDLTSIKVLSTAGSALIKKRAKRLKPLVKRHHLVLVSLVAANAAAATAMPVCLERVTNPVVAILISVTAVVVFGEILPQAICSRYSLVIGYFMSWLVWLIIGLMYVVAYPMSKLLDWMFGKDSGTIYKRKELVALVDIHGPRTHQPNENDDDATCGRKHIESIAGLERLTADEVSIIKSALEMSHKTVSEAMLHIQDVYMLPSHAVLDRHLIQEIFDKGHSRVPVYEGNDRRNVKGVFLTKQLILVDQTLRIEQSFSTDPEAPRALYKPLYVDKNTPMFDLLNQFQTGTLTHMAFVTSTEDDLKTIIGIVTLEDVIEELLQEEIQDESDLHRQWGVLVAKVKLYGHMMKNTNSTPGSNPPLGRFMSEPTVYWENIDEHQRSEPSLRKKSSHK